MLEPQQPGNAADDDGDDREVVAAEGVDEACGGVGDKGQREGLQDDQQDAADNGSQDGTAASRRWRCPSTAAGADIKEGGYNQREQNVAIAQGAKNDPG